MPELRRDPVVGRWVIIAPERALRPDQFKRPPRHITPPGAPAAVSACPFCEGNESMTPPEIRAIRNGSAPNGPGWTLRVVPNKFPALRIEGDVDKHGDGIYDLMNGVGAHEVIVEGPRHISSVTQLSESDIRSLVWLYQERILDLHRDPRIAYCLIFKNVGEAAGASIEHSHSQLIATPIVPNHLQDEVNHCKQYYEFRGRCLVCDLIQQEMSAGVRIIETTRHFISLQPFASRFPFETWLLPRTHQSHFEHMDTEHLAELAHVLRNSIARIERVSDQPPYNYLLHTAPTNWPVNDHYHWHFEIFPRLTRVAGFEWGTGFYINPIPPEEAARYLRDIKL
jgi:UDPglucose--hexose-1-phosphate uridylyltransferase